MLLNFVQTNGNCIETLKYILLGLYLLPQKCHLHYFVNNCRETKSRATGHAYKNFQNFLSKNNVNNISHHQNGL